MTALFEWKSASISDIGPVRKTNEDSVLERPDLGLWAVADGLGGYQKGDAASQAVVNNLVRNMVFTGKVQTTIARTQEILMATNKQLLDYAKNNNFRLVGSTATVLVLDQQWGACVWAGDSRLYLLRQKNLYQVSKDHTLVEDWKNQGYLQEFETGIHPSKNVVTRCLGAEEEMTPDYKVFQLQLGDVFFLATDGFYGYLTETEMIAGLSEPELQIGLTKMMVAAYKKDPKDNLSGVIVRVNKAPNALKLNI